MENYNSTLAFHDREPVVLNPEDWQAWLDGSDAIDLVTPWADDAFETVPASKEARILFNAVWLEPD
ncbi:SOS response-associated peptidase family protein [Asticcacaulis sp.]|uniref:SOS response-associated peptidase family protein n=1 Tax=Asticcacaulis sp. TaxID=1872648 RepID=UPI002C72C90B|nr:SOS response-associated peptidase family protein [Asticcacaulis sp.]HTM82254.1 SOS response-associated peptidase family protein [Asticcacaulis sp.]